MAAFIATNATDNHRFQILLDTLAPLACFITGKHVLDYGASDGLSMSALLEIGAHSVVGVEPDARRVKRGNEYFPHLDLRHCRDTRSLPLPNSEFDVVFVNAVLEHIPQPRAAYIGEIWRVLKPGGHLIVNETPNKYLPWDFHTTRLPLINWLPSHAARAIAVSLGRFRPEADWDHSGWRGLGQYELFSAIGQHRNVSPVTRFRHRIIGQLLDPYPTWVIQKQV